MPLHPTFCGLSVTDWKGSIGWGSEQDSRLVVTLVQDTAQGDLPLPPLVGCPIYFQFFDFRFFGLLQKWSKRNSPSGYPVWEAECRDPRDILRGTEVIVGNYNLGVEGVRNLLNVFGWWENLYGFGSSLRNDSGMPWNLIRVALTEMCNTPVYGLYGGPLTYRGYAYGLDLSEMPVPNIGYRIGGGAASINLLDAIAQICDDGGCDFWVELEGFIIKVRTVSRLVQPPLGTIAAITNTNWGNVLRSEDGLEARNEPTSAFLVGGEVCSLFQTDATGMVSFWGYDVQGNPIVGQPDSWDFYGPPDPDHPNDPLPLLASIPCESMPLNAQGVTDIVGDTSYLCSTLEMRMAMVNYDSWALFIANNRPEIAPFIYSPYERLGVQGGLVPAEAQMVRPDLVNDSDVAAQQVGIAGVTSDIHVRSQRLFDFVKGYATEFYGRKFLVGLPFVLARQDPDTLKVSYTQEPTDGGWLDEDASPLGLSWLNQDVFKTGDGRFRAFVGYAGLEGSDRTRVSPSDSVEENDTLYVRASVEPQMVFDPTTGQPFALLTLNSALYDEAVDNYGGNDHLPPIMGLTPDQALPILNREFGPVGLRVAPAARYPDAAALPLKSNVLTYGPWVIAGAPGKVRFEADGTLTPWNYGGWNEMQLAGTARVINAITNMQVSEAGTLELAGPPVCSLGGVLAVGGPNVTNVDVSYGKEGITTAYRFQTFTPRFGVFSKQLADRIKQLGQTGLELRKAIRAGIGNAAGVADTVNMAYNGFLANAPRAVNFQTPHEVFVSHGIQDGTDVRVCPMSLTYEEAVALARGDDPAGYQATAVMSLEGLLRPFSTRAGGTSTMPGLVTPTSPYGPNSSNLNPFQQNNDITYLASGDNYSRLNSYRAGNDPANTRGLGLRGPIVVSGWGFDLQGNPVPGDGRGGWLANVLRRSDQWKVGPVDLLWDEPRGVWTSPGTRMGTTQGSILAGGSGMLTPHTGSGLSLLVWNPWSVAVSGQTLVATAWVADEGRWNIIAANCPG